jgi:hypothetical protein
LDGQRISLVGNMSWVDERTDDPVARFALTPVGFHWDHPTTPHFVIVRVTESAAPVRVQDHRRLVRVSGVLHVNVYMLDGEVANLFQFDAEELENVR